VTERDTTPRPPAADEPRPRPQYGEYATPEEQRARIRQPDVTAALDAGEAVAAVPAVRPGAAAGAEAKTPRSPKAGQPASAASNAPPRTRTIDRIVTFALLAYGLVNVVTAFPVLVDYGAYADTVFDLMGVDAQLSDPGAGRPWGIAAALVLAVGWFITAVVSWWNVRRGRLTWWIPLVGGIVFTVLSGVLVLIPMMSDPAVWDALMGSVG
jgi:hypothetical protein